jgi:hypothetical protein
MDAAEIIRQGDQLFDKRGTLLSMWQELAEQFYPERADFTVTRNLGDSFAEHLTTSYPLLVRRDLCNSFSPLMRPVSLDWFHMRAEREEVEDQPALAWMEWAGGHDAPGHVRPQIAVHPRIEGRRPRPRHVRPVRQVGPAQRDGRPAALSLLAPQGLRLVRGRERQDRHASPQMEADRATCCAGCSATRSIPRSSRS